MAKQIIPSQITYSCDACNCSGSNDIKLNLNGLKKHDSDEHSIVPFSLDLCGDCVVDFEAWLASYRASKQ